MSNDSSRGSGASPADAGALPARLPLTSADPLAPRYEQLKALFPMAVTDGRTDLGKLRGLMGDSAASGPERYGLTWAGKSDALKALRLLTTATLLPTPSESEKWETTGNAIIEGDNLEVLKVLQHAYHGKVKLIYIDPPYNTGGDFIYPDDYAEGLASYQLFTRQVNEEGVKLTTNVNTSGRYHSRWLTMIYPRLFLARNLLREDGVIFVSIDDNEVHNLRLVMDEIFGEENFLACFCWQKKDTPSNDAEGISVTHEYLLAYTRSEEFDRNLIPRTEKQLANYKNPDNDPRGVWTRTALTRKVYVERDYYSIKNPQGRDIFPPKGTSWRVSRQTLSRLIAENRIWWGKSADGDMPFVKRFLSEVQDGVVPVTWWDYEFAGSNRNSKMEMRALFDDPPFDTPKPVKLLSRVLALGTSPDDLVLDFFAGSGTTAQALFELNLKDGGNRQFILVQLPEPTGRNDFPTVADITKERVRRVIAKIEKEEAGQLSLAGGQKPDLGFKVFKLAPSNFGVWDPALAATDPEKLAEQWQLTADNVRADVQEQALLHELMLKCGLSLASCVEAATAAGTPAYRLDDGKLVVCLARELTREVLRAIIALKPQSVLCLDVGFKGNDALKVNAQLEFQSHGIQFRTA